MKVFFISLILVFLIVSTQAQQLNVNYSTSTLTNGYAAKISKMVANLKDVKSTSFETGVDSFKVFFGSYMEEKEKAYWAVLLYPDGSIFQRFNLNNKTLSNMLSEVIDFKINNTKRISVSILYDPVLDKVFYRWLNSRGSSKIASIQTVDRLIQENKKMPFFKVNELNGPSLSLDNFKNKYLVINWWQTSCKPCILEMPGLNKMVEKYKSRNDVEFVAIAWDDKEKLESFLNKKKFNYKQAVFNEQAAHIFGNSFPKHIIINPQGLVVFYMEGGSENSHLYIEESLDLFLQ